MKNILIVMGHPKIQSYCWALLDNYQKWLELAWHNTKRINLIDYEFNTNLIIWQNDMSLEDVIIEFQQSVKQADHLVFAFPLRWYNMPSILKWFFDRVFLPWFAYKYTKWPLPQQLLQWRTADILLTADWPWWYYLLFWNPGLTALKRSLDFCWIKVRKVMPVYWVRKIEHSKKQKILNDFYNKWTQFN